MRGATEHRSRDDADHAPVEHPARSGPETLHNILTRPHVNFSSYSEDRFKVVLNFVKDTNRWRANSADRGGSPKQGNALIRGRRHDEQVLVASSLVLREGGGPRSESGVLRAPAGSGPRLSLPGRTPRRGLSGVWRRGPRRRFPYRGSSTGRVSGIWIRSGTR